MREMGAFPDLSRYLDPDPVRADGGRKEGGWMHRSIDMRYIEGGISRSAAAAPAAAASAAPAASGMAAAAARKAGHEEKGKE